MKRIAVLGGYLVALLILFIRCTPKDNKPITYNDEVFTRCDTTPATVLAKGLPIHYPASMFTMDSIIGIVDFQASDFFIHLYNEKGQAIGNMVRKGRCLGQMTDYNDFIVKKEEGLVSFYSGKIIEYDVLAYLSDSTSYIKEYPLPQKFIKKRFLL